MGLGEWAAGWAARHHRPARYDQRQMLEAVHDAEPEDADEESYLVGVRDALVWVLTGGATWESDRLIAELYRRAGFDETGRQPGEEERSS